MEVFSKLISVVGTYFHDQAINTLWDIGTPQKTAGSC